MSVYQTYRSRWKPEWTKNVRLRQVEAAINASEASSKVMTARREELTKLNHLNARGMRTELRSFAAKVGVPELRRARAALDKTVADIAARRLGLELPKHDKTDAVAALLRIEARTFLRSLPVGDRNHMLFTAREPLLVGAALEVPGAMSGLPPQLFEQLRNQALRELHGPALDALASEEEAVQLGEAALANAIDDLQRNSEFEGDDEGFGKFMTQSSAEVEREIAEQEARERARQQERIPEGDSLVAPEFLAQLDRSTAEILARP